MWIAARVFVILCALGSLASTLYAGHHNRSILLVGMFAVWVVAPFLGLLGVLRGVERGSGPAAKVFHMIALILGFAALGLYAAFALRPPARNAAAPFLILPMCSWAVVACMFLFARSKRTANSR